MGEFFHFDHPWIDSSKAPLYILYPPSVIANADLIDYLRLQEEFIVNRPHHYVWVCDVGHLFSFDAHQRALVAACDNTLKPYERIYNLGQAWVLESAMARGVLAALYWMSPPVYPTTVVATRAAGIAWAERKLAPHFPERHRSAAMTDR